MVKFCNSSLHPFYLPRLGKPRLEVLSVRKVTVISSSEFYYSWDGSILRPTQKHTVLGTASRIDISLGQITLLILDSIPGPEVDFKAISLLLSSRSLRIGWVHFEEEHVQKFVSCWRYLDDQGWDITGMNLEMFNSFIKEMRNYELS
jgi:hypothetical protein